MEYLRLQIATLFGAIPEFVVWGAGLAACIRNYRYRPYTSLLIGIAIVLAAGLRAVFPMASIFIFEMLLTDVTSVIQRNFLATLMHALPEAVVWGIVLWTIFGLREPERTSPP